jgi:hypothetical protein
LIAWLNVSRDEAVPWFVELVKGRDVLLHCSIAEHFLFHACHSHLDQLGPLIDRMTHSMDDDMAPVLASGNVSSLSFS